MNPEVEAVWLMPLLALRLALASKLVLVGLGVNETIVAFFSSNALLCSSSSEEEDEHLIV